MQTMLNTAMPWTPLSTGSGGDDIANGIATAVDRVVDVLSHIAAVGDEGSKAPERKGATDRHDHALFNANGAPRLALPEDQPAPVSAPTPLNLGFLVSQVQGLRTEANAALVNEESNRAYEQMKGQVDKVMESLLKSIQDFEKKAKEFADKMGSIIHRMIGWAMENLGPVMPYLSVGVAAVATAVTGGAALPMLIVAGLGLAHHVLQKAGINVVTGVSKAIKDAGGGAVLANWVSTNLGVLLSDPTPMSELFGSIAKACGASKSTIETAKLVGQLVGILFIVGASMLGTFGGGAMQAAGKAVSSAGNAAGSAASGVFTTIAESIRNLFRTLAPYLRYVVEILRRSSPRLAELSSLFRNSMQAFSGAAAGTLKGATTSFLKGAAAWQPRLEAAAKVGQLTVNAANGTMAMGNGYREIDLGRTQYQIDQTMAERRKMDSLLALSREHMQDSDEGMKRSMDTVSQNLRSNSNMLSSYTRELIDRAAVQREQMAA